MTKWHTCLKSKFIASVYHSDSMQPLIEISKKYGCLVACHQKLILI